MQQPQTYTLSRSQRNTARVSMDSSWHAAATDLHPVKESEKYSQGQHGFLLACSSHRLTSCQGVREIQPGSAWIPPGMQQPQTYTLSRSQRNTARVSMDSSWHAAATDLQAVKESEKYSQGQHGFLQACSSHRLTYCQGIREIQPGSAWIPPGMQQPQTYKLSRSQRNTARVSMDSSWHAAATDLHPVKESEKYSQGQHGFLLACSSHRLTVCQGVREIQPGSAWIPPGMQQPQTYILSRSQRNTARVSMDSFWHAAATDLHADKESVKYSQGQHGFLLACSSHRLTRCQGVREIQPGLT